MLGLRLNKISWNPLALTMFDEPTHSDDFLTILAITHWVCKLYSIDYGTIILYLSNDNLFNSFLTHHIHPSKGSTEWAVSRV